MQQQLLINNNNKINIIKKKTNLGLYVIEYVYYELIQL